MNGDKRAPRSLNYTLWEMTFNVSQSGLTPIFDVLQQDTNDVIAFINFIIERGETEDYKIPKTGKGAKPKTTNTRSQKDAIWNYI